ncbi:methyltransferase [Desulfobaculum sp. SPO524]|uniref:methyltransferase n=1 Tax=Desulfobaculum sp. SPO524 TaxID=3378071 RepID=UPI003852BEC4
MLRRIALLLKKKLVNVAGSKPDLLSIPDDVSFAAIDGTPVTAGGYVFSEFGINSRKNSILGISQCRSSVIKIQIKEEPNKANTLEQEAQFLAELNAADCISAPRLLSTGSLAPSEVPFASFGLERKQESERYSYIIMQYIPSASTVSIADVLLAIVEQQKLGYFHGDIKPNNVRFDPEQKICILIDYDQSQRLTQEQRDMTPHEFLLWAMGQTFRDSSSKVKIDALHDERKRNAYFNGNAFRIDSTTLYKEQMTTNSESGVYHSFATPDVFADGSRILGTREQWLKKIAVTPDEKVLDVGCNGGVVSFYMHDRGASVTGIDVDQCIVTAAQILANIFNKNVSFSALNLDDAETLPEYDTVLLFSVIHHTEKLERNCSLLATRCNRILIECRLVEKGKGPRGKHWKDTSEWNFESIEDLQKGLENLFAPHKVVRTFGPGDKGRFLFELIKD